MAQGRLIPVAVGAAILVGGAAVEVISRQAFAAAVLDWIVGAAFVVAALLGPAGPTVAVGLLAAAAWFLATSPAALLDVWPGVGVIAVIAYRGPLLHWLVLHARVTLDATLVRPLVVIGYAVALVGTVTSALGTSVVAACLAATVFRASGRARQPADLRSASIRIAIIFALLASLWAVSAVGWLRPPATQILTATCLLVVAWCLSRPAEAATLGDSVGSLVLELGPNRPPDSPLAAALAHALADPDLQVRTFQPDIGWTDELGRAALDPVATGSRSVLTEVHTPAGGRVVLVHGPRGSGDTELARAAAGAAGLALESIRLEAQVRRQAAEVRRSASRLMTIEDGEREALAARLRAGPIARLKRVRLTLTGRDQNVVAPAITELDHVIAELNGLAHGLNPVAVSTGPLSIALEELIAHCGLPVTLELRGDLAAVPEDTRTLVYFVSSECLTNITRHARADRAHISVGAQQMLTVQITDNGCGGATLAAGHGLRGLADRVAVAGGVFEISSPDGGPTEIRAEIPTFNS